MLQNKNLEWSIALNFISEHQKFSDVVEIHVAPSSYDRSAHKKKQEKTLSFREYERDGDVLKATVFFTNTSSQ